MDTFASDTTRPLLVTDRHGNRYLQLLVDAGSGLTRGRPIKLKIDAPLRIIRQMRELQARTGKQMKRYHFDGARELQK